MSDYNGARLIVDALPPAKHLLADRGYDADWFREALQEKGIEPCIRRGKTASERSDTIRPSTNSATKLRTCSGNSKTGGASQHDMIDARIHSFQQYASQLP